MLLSAIPALQILLCILHPCRHRDDFFSPQMQKGQAIITPEDRAFHAVVCSLLVFQVLLTHRMDQFLTYIEIPKRSQRVKAAGVWDIWGGGVSRREPQAACKWPTGMGSSLHACNVVLCGGRGLALLLHWQLEVVLRRDLPHWVCPGGDRAGGGQDGPPGNQEIKARSTNGRHLSVCLFLSHYICITQYLLGSLEISTHSSVSC